MRDFRFPKIENALTVGFESRASAAEYLVLLVLSQGNSGGDEGGLDARKGSSEKSGLSLGTGVDDMLAGGDDLRGGSAILRV